MHVPRFHIQCIPIPCPCIHHFPGVIPALFVINSGKVHKLSLLVTFIPTSDIQSITVLVGTVICRTLTAIVVRRPIAAGDNRRLKARLKPIHPLRPDVVVVICLGVNDIIIVTPVVECLLPCNFRTVIVSYPLGTRCNSRSLQGICLRCA